MGTVLVTGAAGFIGYHLSQKLIESGYSVVGIDNLNNYYDVRLKEARLNELHNSPNAEAFTFIKIDIKDAELLKSELSDYKFDAIVNLAAQAGVRYSIENPQAYIDSNITGFLNILNLARDKKVKHLVYASSSSVYGNSKEEVFSTDSYASHPVSMYAATKRSNELMAHVFAHQYNVPCTGLRFFTVYGPWGRPDMAPMKFAKAMLEGKAIDVYNYGKHFRDFTYIDDIVNGIVKIIPSPPKVLSHKNGAVGAFKELTPKESESPFKVYNIGAHNPVHLLNFIQTLEKELGVEAKKNLLPMQPGDVVSTYADVSELINDHEYSPSTTIENGVTEFIRWYKDFYHE